MDVKRKYLVVLTDLNMGGVTTSAINLCNTLFQKGNEVDVLVMSDGGAEIRHRFAEGIRFLHLTGSDRLWNLGTPMIRREKNVLKKMGLCLLGFAKKCINRRNSRWIRWLFGKQVRYSGYDAALAYRQCAPCYYYVLNNVQATKKAAFVHGDITFMGDISTWRPFLPGFDTLAFVSDAVKERFLQAVPECNTNAVTVYNAFDLGAIYEKAKENVAEKREWDSMQLVTVSRVENQTKGTDRIPRVCRELKAAGQAFHWWVIGGGPDLDACRAEAERLGVADCVTFLGERANPYPYIVQSDVFVFPTRTEAFPMVVGESLILHTPVISTRYPAVEEIVEPHVTGLIAEQSTEALAATVLTLMRDKKQQERLKENCAAFHYDNDRTYKQLVNALF